MGYTEEKSRLLKFLLDGEYLEKEIIESAVHGYLLGIGRAMQEMHLRTRTFPDHLGSAAVFGYALKHGVIHPRDVTFDHGEIAGEYIVASDGLLEDILSQLISYKKFEIPRTPFSGADIFCGCGCC
ncbi:MAG: hypothetical protein HZB10_02785 [Candidatus Yonathbacteria bacterium]|nr:hypothetical protein [Candidatus Yonathbacteria bacterium]